MDSSNSYNERMMRRVCLNFPKFISEYYPNCRFNNKRIIELIALAKRLIVSDGKELLKYHDSVKLEPDFDIYDFSDALLKDCGYFYSLCFMIYTNDTKNFEYLINLYDLHEVWNTIEEIYLIVVIQMNQSFMNILRKHRDMFSRDDDGYDGVEVNFFDNLLESLLNTSNSDIELFVNIFRFALDNIMLLPTEICEIITIINNGKRHKKKDGQLAKCLVTLIKTY